MYTFCHKRVPSGIRNIERVSGKGLFTLVFILLLNLISFGQIAPVNSPSGGFHIDGDLRANTPTAGAGDWVAGSAGSGGHVFSLSGVPVDPTNSFLLNDPYSTNNDDVFSGSSMADNPNNWRWALGSAPAKNEMNRGMINLSPDASGDIWIMAGADRLSTNGTAYIDFELLQNSLVKNPAGTFSSAGPHGGRTIGDLLITVEYNNGGGVSSIFYYRWQALTGGGYGFEAISPGLLGFAITNPDVIDVPFGAFGGTTYNKFQFVEAAVNLSEVVSFVTNDPCVRLSIQTIFIKTKASTSTNAALKDFLEPIQVNFSVGSVEIAPVGPQCLNGSPVTLTGVPPGGTFSGPGVSGNTFTPSVAGLGTHQIIYTKEVVQGCIKRDTIYIQVINSVGGTVSGGTTVCSGTNSGTLTLSGHVGSVIKWQSSTNGINWTDIVNTSTTLTFSNITVATSFRAVVQNSTCDPVNSASALVNVDQPSVGGSVSGGRAVCVSGNSGNLTLSGHTGSVVKWQSSTNNGSSWTDIANTTSTQSYSNLTVATRFRAVVQNGVCAPANSSEAIITIDPISVGGSLAGSTNVCGGSNSGTISLSGQAGVVVKWQQSTNGGSSFTDIAGTAGQTSYTFSNLTQTTIFRAVVKSGACDEVNSSSATVTVDPATDPGSIEGPAAVCDNAGSSMLTLRNYTGTILKWQMSNDGITWMDIANTSATYDIGLITNRMYYRAVVKSGMCDPEYSPAFSVLVIACGPTSNHCTYTQGFYGNVGGLGCSIDPTGLTGNSLELAKTKMLKAFTWYGSSKVIFGRADINGDTLNDRAFTLYRDDIDNDNIFKMLPGGGTQLVIGVKPGGTAYGSNFQGATFSVQSTWNAVPIVPGGSNIGRIKNTLLAQTMTLFFNLYNGTSLGYVVLHDTLYVTDIDCATGNPDSGAVVMKYGLPHEVLVYIAQNSTVYSNNVAGLYKLANDVLGGLETPGLSPALVANAVDQINNAFDECRALIGSFDLPLNTSILSAIPYQQMERNSVMSDKSSLLVETYPNPFREKISFRIRPEESGIGTLDIYSASGQKLRTVFSGYLPAGITRIVEYSVPESQVGSLIYQFQLGKKRVSGKLISLSR